MHNSIISRSYRQLQFIRSIIGFMSAFISVCITCYVSLAIPVDAVGDHTGRILLGFAAPFAILAYILKK